jgi:anti-anti-sigma regulatory factor
MQCTKKTDMNEVEVDLKMKEKEKMVKPKTYYKFIVIDFTFVHFVDEYGVKCLKKIESEYNNENVKIFLTNCNGNLKKIYFLFCIGFFYLKFLFLIH